MLQNIPESTIPSIDAEGNFYANAGQARISMVDTRDVAAVAAALLTEPGQEGAEHDLTGPEALSYEDVASKLSSALGRKITYVDVPDEAVRQTLQGFGLDEWLLGSGAWSTSTRTTDDPAPAGFAAQVTDTVERVGGRPPRSLDGLLEELQP